MNLPSAVVGKVPYDSWQMQHQREEEQDSRIWDTQK